MVSSPASLYDVIIVAPKIHAEGCLRSCRLFELVDLYKPKVHNVQIRPNGVILFRIPTPPVHKQG
jgi:hypothetical protein